MSAIRSDPVKAEIERQILAMLYQNSRMSHWVNNAVCALLVVAVIVDGTPSWRTALFWYAGMTVFDVACYAHALRWQSEPRGIEEYSRGFRRFIFAVAVQALIWAVGIILFMPEASHELRFFILTLVTGMAAGAVPVLAGNVRMIGLYVGILVSAVLFTIVVYGHSSTEYVLLPAVPIFAVAIYSSARQFNDSLLTSMRLSLERQELLNSVQVAHAEAERANRVKGEFVANMSHEIRTPVSVIIGFSELALASPADAMRNSYLSVIHRSAESLLRVLNGVLDFSKVEANKLVAENIPFRLADVLDNLDAIFGRAAEKKYLSYLPERGPDLPVCVEGDPLRLHQVLTNLLDNAIKFTHSGSISLKVVRRFSSQADGRVSLTFAVLDTGIGIDDSQRELIFESFTQADTSASRRFGGTGLGLTISRSLVTLMGGTGPGLNSRRGYGSEFSFEIPFGMLPDNAVRPAAQNVPIPPGAKSNGRHVLLVEDTTDFQEVFSSILTRAGYQVSFANNGAEALQLCAKQSFSAVLMDVQMPVMDGLEATRRIRERERMFNLPRMPVVALTADIRYESRAECLEADADCHLVKPVRIAELLGVLDRLHPEVPDAELVGQRAVHVHNEC